MNLVRVHDLVGKDVAGKLADVRCRYASGELIYKDLYAHHPGEYEPGVFPLKRVCVKKDKGTWLQLEWDGRGAPMHFQCGYSGRKLTGKYCEDEPKALESAREWFILADLEAI